MVNCTCTVEAVDRACINTPQYCYRCCTTGPAIKTCPYHFHLMGNTAAAARLASSLVHPTITSIGAGSPSSTASVTGRSVPIPGFDPRTHWYID